MWNMVPWAVWGHGGRTSRTWEQTTKRGTKGWSERVRRPLSHSDSNQYLKLPCMMYSKLWSSCYDTVHPGCSVPLRTNLPIKFMVSADLLVCSHLAGWEQESCLHLQETVCKRRPVTETGEATKKHWKGQLTVGDCNYCQSQKDNGKRTLKQECWGCNRMLDKKFSIFNSEGSTT